MSPDEVDMAQDVLILLLLAIILGCSGAAYICAWLKGQ